MTMSMYAASVPLFRQLLGGLAGVLDKGASFAQAKGVEETVLLNARLAPDMFALTRQVHVATDMAKGCIARLAGIDIPSYDDNEKSFAELKERIARTLTFIAGVPASAIDDTEEKAIVLKMRAGEVSFTGQRYLTHYVIPNVAFHCATTYNILRHNGVDIGKRDFLGSY